MKYYTNRELARLFSINLAKWKRWSREFLPPDPLGGLQSGYARQYHHDDAFTVYLGGHLVSDLRFTIPEAKCILSDLASWFAAAGYYENSVREAKARDSADGMVKDYQVYIRSQTDASIHSGRFLYTIRGILSEQETSLHGYPVRQIQFIEKSFSSEDVESPPARSDVVTLLNISDVFHRFLHCLKGA